MENNNKVLSFRITEEELKRLTQLAIEGAHNKGTFVSLKRLILDTVNEVYPNDFKATKDQGQSF